MPSKDQGRLSHAKRGERRKKIAEAVKRGATLSAAARKFRVSLHTVRGACNEHNVRWEK